MDKTSQSLLLRASEGSNQAWDSLTALYRPLIHRWVLRCGVSADDADDLTQDVLTTLVVQLPHFVHTGQPGAFRTWLRTVATNRARLFWRSRKAQPPAEGGDSFLQQVDELEDSHSELARQWDREHDDHILRCLLEVINVEFEPATVLAFRGVALEGHAAQEVADELGLSVGAVYVARSRVLRRLREEAAGLID
jgi:RNA polymerase sigma-70 factor (ECF subfamily)